jgi:hypothetical protein
MKFIDTTAGVLTIAAFFGLLTLLAFIAVYRIWGGVGIFFFMILVSIAVPLIQSAAKNGSED